MPFLDDSAVGTGSALVPGAVHVVPRGYPVLALGGGEGTRWEFREGFLGVDHSSVSVDSGNAVPHPRPIPLKVNVESIGGFS